MVSALRLEGLKSSVFDPMLLLAIYICSKMGLIVNTESSRGRWVRSLADKAKWMIGPT